MTGIERLQGISMAFRGYTWGASLSETLGDIAGQIVREHAEDCFRMGERAADASMSAYEFLPEEEREAVAWVRDHGGLEVLRRMFQDADSRRVELCAALGIDLDKGWSEAMATLSIRLMPEGYEWLRYEDGSLLRYDNFYIGNDGNNHRAWQIRFDSDANVHVSRSGDGDGFDRTTWDHFNKGARVKRPIPAADGELLEVGQPVWFVEDGDDCVVAEISSDGRVRVEYFDGSGSWHDASELTHTKPEPPDSWERIEEDATKNPFDYCKDVGHRLDTCENSEAYKARDLVRRCRALAERERGE